MEFPDLLKTVKRPARQFEARTLLVEAGQLFLPEQAPWLDTFRKELLAFPSSRHDDQVDALSQLLERTRRSHLIRVRMPASPILVPLDWDYRGPEEERLYGSLNTPY